MKIVIATPIYPPEIGAPASYIKELAKRLAKNHKVTVVMYGRLPEKLPGVSFICIDKRRPLLVRLLHFSFILLKEALRTDVVYAENGASVELPIGIISFFSRKPIIMHMGDKLAEEKARGNKSQKRISGLASKNAYKILKDIPLERPEVLPFDPLPQSAFDAYEDFWKRHINMLEDLFKNAK